MNLINGLTVNPKPIIIYHNGNRQRGLLVVLSLESPNDSPYSRWAPLLQFYLSRLT